MPVPLIFLFFFFNDTATTEIYTLSLHDALPISDGGARKSPAPAAAGACRRSVARQPRAYPCASQIVPGLRDRKSTRLNSSHQIISYAVFCLKKKKPRRTPAIPPTPQQHATTLYS